MDKKGRVYVCHTYYHVYVALLKEFNLDKEERFKADLVLSLMSNDFENLSDRILENKVFENVYLFDEKRETFFPEVMKYKENNDMTAVSEKMSSINVHNEIGTLADSFAEFAEEIDRHTNEIIKLNGEKQKIAAELSLATNIQSSMLPDKFPDRKEFDIFASMDPAKEVGGDFYDFFLIDEDHLAVVIADVSGKGVPAALFMMSSMILINDHALMGGTPAEILERINNQICKTNKAHMFVTVWLGILEISTGKLTASSAGHEFPMINTNGKFELLKDKHGMPVGAFKKTKYKDYELTLKKGDIIFLYTDGVAEATNADNQLFGTDRTLDALNKNPDAAPEELLKNVRAAVDEFVKDARSSTTLQCSDSDISERRKTLIE